MTGGLPQSNPKSKPNSGFLARKSHVWVTSGAEKSLLGLLLGLLWVRPRPIYLLSGIFTKTESTPAPWEIEIQTMVLDHGLRPWFQPLLKVRRPPDYSSNLCPPKTFAIWLLGGCLGLPSCCFSAIKGPKHPLKKSYSKIFRRIQIWWVIWQSSKDSFFLKDIDWTSLSPRSETWGSQGVGVDAVRLKSGHPSPFLSILTFPC